MSNFTKERHIELSDGGTMIISNDKCPLSEYESSDMEIILNVDDKKIPCCVCIGYVDEEVNSQCPHYFGYTNGSKGEHFDCALLEPRKSRLNS